MSAWSSDELRELAGADEFGIASRRADGSMRRYVTIWGVRVGNEIYIRSAYGSENPWYRRAVASGEGRVRGGGVERDVQFLPAAEALQESIDAAYRAKYDRYGPRIVGTVVGSHAHGVTLRLVPKDTSTG